MKEPFAAAQVAKLLLQNPALPSLVAQVFDLEFGGLPACRVVPAGWLGLSCLGFALIRALPLVRSFAVLVLRLLLGVRCLFALDRFRLRCFRLKFQHGRPDALGQGVYAPGVQTLGIDYPRKFAS